MALTVAAEREDNVKAVGLFKSGAGGEGELRDVEVPDPTPRGRDLLVRVKAAAINPADVKSRRRATPDEPQPSILGFDAAGVVEAVGPDVRRFRPGDEIFYAGTIARPGAYAELQVVDERITGPKPKSLSFAAAAALPLTAITAWEMLFDRLGVPMGAAEGSLLVIGAAGGVGSITLQLARRLTGLTVIGTASQPQGRAWCLRLGAHHVIDHSRALAPQVAALGAPPVGYVFGITGTDSHWLDIAEIVAPQGKVGLIDDPEPVDLRLVKLKSVSVHWENMFTRSVFETADIDRQGLLLARVSQMVDDGALQTTLAEVRGPIRAAVIEAAHRAIMASHAPGKMVLEGF